jgi:hypothetical protein
MMDMSDIYTSIPWHCGCKHAPLPVSARTIRKRARTLLKRIKAQAFIDKTKGE